MFSQPNEKRVVSLSRILRNEKLCFASFTRGTLDVAVIYEVSPRAAADEAERQLDVSSNEISHISFSSSWTSTHGTKVWPVQHDEGYRQGW
ncbi:MAG: hypothetical protein FGM33_08870 [Candidatus Kapabacteria bacterium]|nr:hypothetical protein [Candidatus Kapabacteria bacterium]